MKKSALLLIFSTVLLQSCDFYYDPYFDARDRITGVYFVNEYSQTFNSSINYDIRIVKSHNRERILIENFYDTGITINAQYFNDKIIIPRQKKEGFELEGTATVWGNRIDFTFSVRDTHNRNKLTDFCEAEAWRYSR
jgi:hypothetical protein